MRKRVGWVCAGLAVVWYVGWLSWRFSPAAGGSDASGYLNSARLIANGQAAAQIRIPAAIAAGKAAAILSDFCPLGFRAAESPARLLPTYPLGVPAHLALAARTLGWRGGTYAVGLFSALGALAVCYLLARRFVSHRASAFLAAASLAVSSVFVLTSVQVFSDTLATFWCSVAVLAAIIHRRKGIGWAVVSGAAAGIAVCVRPTDVLVLPAVIWLLRRPSALGAAALGGLPFVVLVGWYQNKLYGSPLASGYGNGLAEFAPSYIGASSLAYVKWLLPLLPVSLFLIFVPAGWRRTQQRSEITALIIWVAAFAVFYGFYRHTHISWQELRFLEPAFPAIVCLAAVGFETCLGAATWLPAASAVMICAAVACNYWSFRFPNGRKHDRMFEAATRWANRLPSDAVIIAMQFSGTIYFGTEHAILRWDAPPRERLERYFAAMASAGVPTFAVLEAFELADPRIKNLPVRWQKLATFDRATAWKLLPETAAALPPPGK